MSAAMRWSIDQLNPKMRAQAVEKIRQAGNRARASLTIVADPSSELIPDPPTHAPISKYRNRRVEFEGEKFDSIAEVNRWRDLQLMQRAGEIRDLARQVRFKLEVNGVLICWYVADFVYRKASNGHRVVEDTKGYKDGGAYRIFKVKKALMLAVHGIDVKET